jgi:cysteine desulfuration protein SufE
MPELDHIIETFDFLTDWDDRYRFIEELGSSLGSLPPELKNDDTIVNGCASNVWVIGHPDKENPKIFCFEAEAEQPIIRGLVYLMLQIYSGKSADEILVTDMDETFERLNLGEHLSPQRHIGMYALVQKMKAIASPYSSRKN